MPAGLRIVRDGASPSLRTNTGICIACIAYLYGNRLLSADMAGRDTWEIRLFLCAWGTTLVHALARAPARAWVEQLGTAAALCLVLPLLNGATTGQHLGTYAEAGDWQRAGVEAIAIAFGAALALAAWRVRRRTDGTLAPSHPPAARRGMGA